MTNSNCNSSALEQPSQGTVAEYIAALKRSQKFGPAVIAHRIEAATTATTCPIDFLAPELQAILRSMGIESLYSHQQEAIAGILQGKSTVVATPTASGKSLIYTLPILQTLLREPSARALCLFPLKALAQDQLKAVDRFSQQLPQLFGDLTAAALYDGDTSAYFRKKIREALPSILITNPDMLHLSMLPHHDQWATLFANLRYVVIDEVHTYRGVFGSHVAWVMRRLKRICTLYGSNPVFIMASATIGNPDEHAQLLIEEPVEALTRSGAGRAVRNIVLLNPLDGAATSATLLLEAAVSRNLRTIVYCQSRKMTELITIWAEQRIKGRKGVIASYRSGFLPEERRAIEARLSDGSLLGVISTSALELGIDIGNLDICILVGYPGSMMATWQRAGRVGRKQQESLVVLIGHEDALDQHFMRNPDDFFARSVEPVTINPDNPHIAAPQLCCAAAELPLTSDDHLLQDTAMAEIVARLTLEGKLLQSSDGQTWFSALTYPQRHVNLRGGGSTMVILEQPHRKPLGEIDGYRALRECHPGAIYLHMARTYHVDSLDLEGREILVSPVKPPYFTRVLTEKTTEIIQVRHSLRTGSARVHQGGLRVTEVISGYNRIAHGSMRTLGRVPLQLPPQVFETEGFWIEIPEWIRKETEKEKLHFMGGIHALEHALIGLMPLLVLCDRNDLGGISHPWHDQVNASAVFVYDGYAGGMGLSAKAFASIAGLLAQTRQAVAACPCDFGCPSCVHSPKCGSGNRPIDKAACLFILGLLASNRPHPQVHTQRQPAPTVIPLISPSAPTVDLPARYGVFDLETQRSAQEVGGWQRAELMRVSVAVLYESEGDRFRVFTEETVDQLIQRLFALDLVIGFNNKRFDNKVLSAYTKRDLSGIASFDILEIITAQLGYRLSLDRLAEKTLKAGKQGNGLMALQWFRQGQMEQLTEYCRKDVEITRDLFLYGLRQRHLLFQNKAGHEVRLPVDFVKAMEDVQRRRLQWLTARSGPCAPIRSDPDVKP